jgi:serine/threonine protein kinase
MGKPTFASDLYSLGVTCIHLLTNIEPFNLFDVSKSDWVWRDYLKVKVNKTLGQVLDKLLQQGTKKRFQTVQEVLDALQLTVKPTPPPTTQLTPQPDIELKSATGVNPFALIYKVVGCLNKIIVVLWWGTIVSWIGGWLGWWEL